MGKSTPSERAKKGHVSRKAPGVTSARLEGSPFNIRSLLANRAVGRSCANYQANEMLFRQDDAADSLFYILDGQVQLAVVSEDGKERIIAVLQAGDFLGEGCLAGQLMHMTSAIAISAVKAIRIEKTQMNSLLRECAEFAHLFMTFLLSRNIRTEADLVDHLFNTSERRLARILLLLAGLETGTKKAAVIPKVNQESLAARVGTTRSRVNLFMNKFRNLGFINYCGDVRGDVVVHASLRKVGVVALPPLSSRRGPHRDPPSAFAA